MGLLGESCIFGGKQRTIKRARARDPIDNVADHGRLYLALHKAALRFHHGVGASHSDHLCGRSDDARPQPLLTSWRPTRGLTVD